MKRPLLLDLFCGAGGCAVGYHRAGFDVIGVDIEWQPNYPFDFFQGTWEEGLSWFAGDVGVIHASPPCQAYVSLAKGEHPDLVAPVRAALLESVKPYVIENVVGAPLFAPVMLCGSMFGLHVRRHRLFECSHFLFSGSCNHKVQGTIRAYYGKKGHLVWRSGCDRIHSKERETVLYRGSVEESPADMGIDWMTWDELTQAIPPSYTEWIGKQLVAIIQRQRNS